MPEGIDSFGAHFYAIPQTENTLLSFAAGTAMRFSDDGVIAVAVDAALAGRFLQAVNTDKPFDKNLDQLNEESEFLDGDYQRVVLFAQMAFHELRGLPFHQFALGAIGAALRFRTFRSDFLKFDSAVWPEHRYWWLVFLAVP